MNLTNEIEDRLNELGRQLQNRPTLVGNVKRQLEMELPSIQGSRRHSPIACHRKQYRRLAISASLLAAVAIFLWTAFSTSTATIAFAQVVEAVRQQRWLHGQTQYANGKQGQMWLALDQNLWAYRLGDSCYFYDGQQRARFELNEQKDAVHILPLGEEDKSHALPTQSLTEEAPTISWLLSTEKVMYQEQRRIQDEGRQWIEFELKLWRGEDNLAILRVDPETRLPVRLVLSSGKNSAKSTIWDFDYPATGPSDIYAMGVKRELPIVDLRPEPAAQRVIDEMSASRKRIGDFQMLVSIPLDSIGYAVWRQGRCWRVDLCYLTTFAGQPWSPTRPWPTTRLSPDEDNINGSRWFYEQVGMTERIPLYICDGNSVWHNESTLPGTTAVWKRSSLIAPTDLMSGEGLGNLAGAGSVKFPSLLYPDLSRKSGWEFAFDESTKDDSGLVVIKRSARLATATPQVSHEWYFVDPNLSHAVVKAELFTVSADQPADPDSTDLRQTIIMKDLQNSANGTWVARSIEMSSPVVSQQMKVSGQIRTAAKFDIIFDPHFHEGLFDPPREE